jgi:hypothetical protein
VASNGAATITVNVNAANQLSVTEGSSTLKLGAAGANLSITLLSGNAELDVQLDTGLAGNLTINLASGNRNLILTGAANTVGGNLVITAGAGDQFVELTGLTDLTVRGFATISLGVGDDSVSSGTSTSIGGNMTLLGVNHMDSGSLTVGGNFFQSVAGESVISDFGLLSEGPIHIGGGFSYQGNNLSDEIDFTTGGSVGGNVYMDLGINVDPFSNQGLNMDGITPMTIRGNLTLLGGFNVAGVPDLLLTRATSTIGGNIYVNFGAGAAYIVLAGTVFGSSIMVAGSGDNNLSVHDLNAGGARLTALFGAGNDTVNFDVTATTLASAYLDGGFGTNAFNQTGTIAFPFTLRNFS